MILDVPSQLDFEIRDDKVRFRIDDVSTQWMMEDDSFIKRIDESNLNPVFLRQHLLKEMEIKNTVLM